MKTLLLAACLLALPALALAQGALAPTGAPAATMKTLDQLEARTPLGAVGGSTAAIAITQPGSYVLLGNVLVESGSGIIIGADNVTLDLNGFTVESSSSTVGGIGIQLGRSMRILNNTIFFPVANPVIRNGRVVSHTTYDAGATGDQFIGAGFQHGIMFQSASAPCTGAQVHDVSVTGIDQNGIYLGLEAASTIVNCTARICGNYGISAAVVTRSVADLTGNGGIMGTTITDSFGSSSSGDGINGHSISNCEGHSSSSAGIYAMTATGCIGSSETGNGLYVTTAVACIGTSTSATGLYALLASECTGGSNSGYGLYSAQATSCRGTSTSAVGLWCTDAFKCHGSSGNNCGIIASTAANCHGSNSSSTYATIAVTGLASFCTARNSAGAGSTAISANHAFACHSDDGGIVATYKDFCH